MYGLVNAFLLAASVLLIHSPRSLEKCLDQRQEFCLQKRTSCLLIRSQQSGFSVIFPLLLVTNPLRKIAAAVHE